MLTVYLLRHGETTWNADGNRYCGATDVELTPLGLTQAQQARELLRDTVFDAVYSSPLQRAFITAQLASGREASGVITDPRLREASFGSWEGKRRSEFIAEDPDLWVAWDRSPETTRAGGTGDTGMDIVTKADAFFKEAYRAHPDGKILVAAHNTVNRFFLAHKLGMPLRNYRRIVQKNSAITRFTMDENFEIELELLNCR